MLLANVVEKAHYSESKTVMLHIETGLLVFLKFQNVLNLTFSDNVDSTIPSQAKRKMTLSRNYLRLYKGVVVLQCFPVSKVS